MWSLLGLSTISGFSLGTWYTLALRANGTAISVEINGSPVIGPVTNTAFTTGNAGVWSYQPSSTGSHRFDNFSVTVLGGGVYRKAKGLAMVDARRILALPSAPPTNQTYRVYYYAAGKPIAMREMPAGNNTGTLYYLHSDHLGSTSVTTNASGGVVARQWYYPFGSVRGSSGTLPTQRTFTGQIADDTGLYFYNARYYSGALGRFVSADTVVPGAGNPQALNRYMFVYGNPLKYTDPSGHDPKNDYGENMNNDCDYAGIGCPDSTSVGQVAKYYRRYAPRAWKNRGEWQFGAEPRDTLGGIITGYQLGLEWLTGLGERNREFGPGDAFTTELRNYEGVTEDALPVISTALGSGNLQGGDASDDLAGLQGIPKAIRNYSASLIPSQIL